MCWHLKDSDTLTGRDSTQENHLKAPSVLFGWSQCPQCEIMDIIQPASHIHHVTRWSSPEERSAQGPAGRKLR